MANPATEQRCGFEFVADNERFICSLKSGHTGSCGRIELIQFCTCGAPSIDGGFAGTLCSLGTKCPDLKKIGAQLREPQSSKEQLRLHEVMVAVSSRFESGNSIPVERAYITRAELNILLKPLMTAPPVETPPPAADEIESLRDELRLAQEEAGDSCRTLDAIARIIGLPDDVELEQNHVSMYIDKIRASVETSNELPAILFDGMAVYQALKELQRRRTSWENVSDTLDAVVRLLRAEKTPVDPLAAVRWICPKCTTVNGIDDETCLGGSCGTKRPTEKTDSKP